MITKGDYYKKIFKRNYNLINSILYVLYVNDDQQEIEELLANGYSSKTWESKCLIVKPAKDKTDEEKIAIT